MFQGYVGKFLENAKLRQQYHMLYVDIKVRILFDPGFLPRSQEAIITSRIPIFRFGDPNVGGHDELPTLTVHYSKGKSLKTTIHLH